MQNSLALTTLDQEKIDLIKKTVAKGATDDELKLFMHICNRTGLDPFSKQIYAIKMNGQMNYITGVDGFRLIADRTKRYAPGKEPFYEKDEQGRLIAATAYVKKQTADGTWHEVAAKVYLCEYSKNSGTWKSMPCTMLAKVAECCALRKAFPAELSAVYGREEMEQAVKEELEEPQTPQEALKEEIKIEVIDIPPLAKEERKQLPAEPLTQAQVNWARNVFKEYGITFDDIQQEWDCCDLENMLQSNLKEFMNNVRAKWGRKHENSAA